MRFEFKAIIPCFIAGVVLMHQPAQARGKLRISQVPPQYASMDELLTAEAIKDQIEKHHCRDAQAAHNANPIDGCRDAVELVSYETIAARIYAQGN